MRLIRLKIRNIASLKGEHEIDFLSIQQESPLFAITGETGAGKSTVLNCIGLALYGQIYKKNVGQLDVVTLGEKDGSIELIFQVKGKFYLADWRARVRKQNGESYSTPQTPVRNLYTLEGNDFASPKTIASVTISELLNLDFDQFCKCIILNQGEFARFLQSSFTDRKEILEKLYPGELLDNISRELDQEKKALEKTKHELEIELQTLQGDNVSGDDLKAEKEKLEKELKSLEGTFTHFEKLEYHFVSLFSYYEKYIKNEQSKDSIKKVLTSETTKYNHLLKAGEALLETYQSARKQQETELPLLQTFLKKEETLKLLEEGWKNIQKKVENLGLDIKNLDLRIEQKKTEEESSNAKLETLKSKFTLPVNELKTNKDRFQELFDLFSEKEVLSEEIKGKTERLSGIESTGKDLKTQVGQIESAIALIPTDVKEREKEIEQKKLSLQKKSEDKQRAVITSQELMKQLESARIEVQTLTDKITALNLLISKTKEDILPLEATLKLQEVFLATETCLEHALIEKKENCPVCESAVPAGKWDSLKSKLASTDLKSIRKKFDEGEETIFKSQKEQEHLSSRLAQHKTEIAKKETDLSGLSEIVKEDLPSLGELEKELDAIKKMAWELATYEKELNTKKIELQKVREQYAKLKTEITEREKDLSIKDEKLLTLSQVLVTIVPVINKDTIRELKNEVRELQLYLAEESALEKIRSDKDYLLKDRAKLASEKETLHNEEAEHSSKTRVLKEEVQTALNGERASDLIEKLNQLVKTATDEWNRHSEEQKKQELVLKDSQSRLSQLDELNKDYDLHFTRELHQVKDLGLKEVTRPESSQLLVRIKDLALALTSPRELYVPLLDLIQKEKENYKNETNECRMRFASVATKLSAWEKLQDKIQLLLLKSKDVNETLDRKMRLYEVLGKDELRTFVLSLVEESLIHQTNDELQKLCQGRYEIVHQTKAMKMSPEFYILDKFREGGRRKVSTLSGGETFMVSLAMALGLAEMTRGQAEIDSLFIDEGFGTLDQESLEDVLDMLQQIQTRGLMVGVISHIKTLTTALPVNLVLQKKQDGTSTIGFQRN